VPREAGFVVGARVRQVNDNYDEEDWKDADDLGVVIGVDRRGYVEVKFPSDRHPVHHPEDCWDSLRVVGNGNAEPDDDDEYETPEEAVAREAGFPVGAWVWQRDYGGQKVEVCSVKRGDDGSYVVRAQYQSGVFVERPSREFTFEDPTPALRAREAAYRANADRFPIGSRVDSVNGRRNGKVLQPRFDGVDVLWEGKDKECVPAEDLVPTS
jgi:hypothetical protein